MSRYVEVFDDSATAALSLITNTPEQQRRAALTVVEQCGYDRAEARRVLDMLGLTGPLRGDQ